MYIQTCLKPSLTCNFLPDVNKDLSSTILIQGRRFTRLHICLQTDILGLRTILQHVLLSLRCKYKLTSEEGILNI